MRQTFILPDNRFDNLDRVKNGLGDIQNITMAHDINELSPALQAVKDEDKIVVIEWAWDQGYELAIQDCAKDPMARREFINRTPVICIHGNPAWVSPSLQRKMYDEIGVVGFVSTKDTFTGINQHSRLRDVILALQTHEGEITPQVFNEIVANLPEPTPKRRARGMHL